MKPIGHDILEYRSLPEVKPRRTRWLFVLLLLLFTPTLVLILFFAMVMTGLIAPD